MTDYGQNTGEHAIFAHSEGVLGESWQKNLNSIKQVKNAIIDQNVFFQNLFLFLDNYSYKFGEDLRFFHKLKLMSETWVFLNIRLLPDLNFYHL